jgi:hypothetical protein
MKTSKPALSSAERTRLLATLEARFGKHRDRHPGLAWDTVRARLETRSGNLGPLHEMERTGGEPDVVAMDAKSGEVTFYDCSAESPKDRRSLCYDNAALEARKEHKPGGSAVEMARAMGIEILTEDQYRELQRLGPFDTKTSSWVLTPPAIRKLGGALFCDRRYDQVFLYHNGAESYYAARGFRGRVAI